MNMRLETMEERIVLPPGVTAQYDDVTKRLIVKGPKGESSRQFFDPKIALVITGDAITVTANQATLMQKKRLFTLVAHAKNMVKGVTEGYTYRLKICSGHFPMAVSVKGKTFEIKNFIGEKVPRTLTLKEGVEVKVEGDQVTVAGFDKERVGQVAADIEQLSRRPGYDTRIFQDGIFIVDKNGKKMV